MLRSVLMSLTVLAFASPSLAQICYEPVQYQYGEQNRYYYGGSDPRVHARANDPMSSGRTWGRVNGFDFISGNIDTHREVSSERPRVYSDALPWQDARYFGFTANDARNEAYANAPRYFRKSDMLSVAYMKDGVWVIPAAPQAHAQVYTAPRAVTAPAPSPAMPRPLMVIPKKALERGNGKPVRAA